MNMNYIMKITVVLISLVVVAFGCSSNKVMNTITDKETNLAIVIHHVGMINKPIKPIVFSKEQVTELFIDKYIKIYGEYIPEYEEVNCRETSLQYLIKSLDHTFFSSSDEFSGLHFGCITIKLINENKIKVLKINDIAESKKVMKYILDKRKNIDYEPEGFKSVEEFFCTLAKKGWPCKIE